MCTEVGKFFNRTRETFICSRLECFSLEFWKEMCRQIRISLIHVSLEVKHQFSDTMDKLQLQETLKPLRQAIPKTRSHFEILRRPDAPATRMHFKRYVVTCSFYYGNNNRFTYTVSEMMTSGYSLQCISHIPRILCTMCLLFNQFLLDNIFYDHFMRRKCTLSRLDEKSLATWVLFSILVKKQNKTKKKKPTHTP